MTLTSLALSFLALALAELSLAATKLEELAEEEEAAPRWRADPLREADRRDDL